MNSTYDLIEAYLEDILSPDDKKKFENSLANDMELQQKVDNHRTAKILCEGLLEADMMLTFEKVDKMKNLTPTSTREASLLKSIKFKYGAVAAAIVGILLMANWGYHFFLDTEVDKEKLLATYIIPVDDSTTKSVDTVGMNTFEKGKYYFGLNRFKDSETWLLASLKNENDITKKSLIYYWLGAAYLEQGKVAKAKIMWENSQETVAKKNLELLK